MSHPHGSDDHADSPTTAWGDGASDATQIVRQPAGGYDHAPSSAATPATDLERPAERSDPFSHPMPAVSAPPVGSPITGGQGSADPGGWSPSYSDQPVYPPQAPMTSVYPPSTPGYAPAGYPAAYAPPVAVPPPASAVVLAQPSSRVGPGFLGALIGLILAAGGVFLAVKFGPAAAADIQLGKVGLKDSLLTTLGALMLFAAIALDGWSPWATVIPGVALTGLGGWALFSTSGLAHINDWTKSVFADQQFGGWSILGFTLILGLVMLGASGAATVARSSGKRDGAILGRREP
ncbi:hypothetical protein ABIB25_001186 [Nakamurella sp. UYEF19]|uniref:hypothetical protein n=1 Tax=Nakamurella sp. UYEF19 TaxID=1756392 RepID=UPI003392F47F